MSFDMVQQRRDEIIDVLTDAYARDLLDTEAYEYRVTCANTYTSLDELNSLITDLRTAGQGYGGGTSLYPVEGSTTLNTILSTQHHDGNWLSSNHIRVNAILGTVVCDFRRPVMGPLTRIQITAVMGEVKIIIPRGMPIDVNVAPILGEVSRHRGDNRILRQVKGIISNILGGDETGLVVNPRNHPAARIEVSGTAVMSSIRIIEKDSNDFG